MLSLGYAVIGPKSWFQPLSSYNAMRRAEAQGLELRPRFEATQGPIA